MRSEELGSSGTAVRRLIRLAVESSSSSSIFGRQVEIRAAGDVLYVDPSDSRYWELIYPDSQLHGGGPPTLRNLSEAAARKKYGI
jgi:Immunity protein 27